MKTASLVILSILFAGMLMVSNTIGFEKGENRILDSSFEVDSVDQLADSWSLEDGTCCDRGAEYQWFIDDSEVHSGSRSLKVVGVIASGTNWHAKVRFNDSSMENGKTFTLAFWAKVDASEGNSRDVTTSIQMQQDPWTGFHSADITLDSTDWKEYTDTFDATEDVVEGMWVGLSIAQSDIDFWIDDYRFFEGNPADELVVTAAVEPVDKLSVSWGRIKSE
jgi:hypothetical protein